MIGLKKYKGAAAAAGIAYTWSETFKNIQQTRAIVVPEPTYPSQSSAASQVDSSTITQADSATATQVDLAPIARPFSYVEAPISKNQVNSGPSLADHGVFYPNFDPSRGHIEIDSSTGGSDINLVNTEVNLFHSNPSVFDPSLPPNYLPPDFIQKSSDAAELGKLLLQWGPT